jgi:HSP20 family protein
MTIIRRISPRSDLTSFRATFDRLFDDNTFRPLAWGGPVESRLPLDITSTEDAIMVEAALPGIRPEDVEITVHQDTLTIGVREQAQRETQEGQPVYRELRRSSGRRTLTLPSGLDIDAAEATFDNGLLRLAIPRAEAAKPRQIQVKSAVDGHATVGAAATTQSEPETAKQA